MGMIKRADIEGYTRDAYVMDLSDLEKRGNALVDAASTKATQIIRDAQREREQLISSAQGQGHAEGYEAGHREGLSKGLEEGIAQARAKHAQQLEQISAMWTEQLGYFEQHRETMLESARVQIVELATSIAKRVIRRTIELDPSVVLDQLAAVLSSITETTRLVVRVHPDDAQLVRAELPGMVDRFASCEHAQIVTDPSLQPGSCVACTASGGIVDASISTQLDRIVRAILPGDHNPDRSQELDEQRSKASELRSDTEDQQEDAA